MLDRFAGHHYYCFLDEYSRYNQIVIAAKDEEKTTFTCPYVTFAFRRMSFSVCNAPATFQCCMMAIFADLVEDVMEIFMDDLSIFCSSFDRCLHNLGMVPKRCEEKQVVLYWEKYHFVIKEGIVLGQRVSKDWLEVDRAEISTIEHVPPLMNMPGFIVGSSRTS